MDKDAGLVCNRFREWIRVLELYVTGSESGKGAGHVCNRFRG